MAAAEDAATVLDQFCHDIANLPAEIAHLLEEIQAKDGQLMQCRDAITSRDSHLQRHVKQNGSHVKHPKEDAFSKAIMTSFDRMEQLQAEKLSLSEKAMILLERQIKRFDVKLRDLQISDQFPHDPSLPSLLQPSTGNTAPPLSGVSTPLQSLSINAAQGGGAPNIANAAIARASASTGPRAPALLQNPLINLPPNPVLDQLNRKSREHSADANKRRRLNASLGSLPPQSSNLRQSSTGPSGTAKPGTPGSVSRAGSAQPSRAAAAAAGTSKKAPAGASKRLAPHQAAAQGAGRKRIRSSILPSKKGDRRRQLARERGRGSPSASPTPSTSQHSGSPTPSNLAHGHDGSGDGRARAHDDGGASDGGDLDAEGEEDDTQVYCSCQRVSFGDMVACDNENCKYQWFHWGCVGLKEEPKGDWLCPFCRQLPPSQIQKAK